MHTSIPATFPLGQIVATQLALKLLKPWDIHAALTRHAAKDWGDVCPEDLRANDDALKFGNRLLSVYHSKGGERFWIITEADRSSTTILMPEDY